MEVSKIIARTTEEKDLWMSANKRNQVRIETLLFLCSGISLRYLLLLSVWTEIYQFLLQYLPMRLCMKVGNRNNSCSILVMALCYFYKYWLYKVEVNKTPSILKEKKYVKNKVIAWVCNYALRPEFEFAYYEFFFLGHKIPYNI